MHCPLIALLGDRATEAPDQETVLATVVCLSVAGSDLAPDDEVVSRELRRFRGRMVNVASGRTLAVFDGPIRAIRFASALTGSEPGGGSATRAGVQTGEVLLDVVTVTGLPAEVATRLAEVATPGQVLATSTVRDLVAGSGIRFLDATGAQELGEVDSPRVLVVDRESVR